MALAIVLLYQVVLIMLYALRAYARHDGPWWLAFLSVWEPWWYLPLPIVILLALGSVRTYRSRLILVVVPLTLWTAHFGDLFWPNAAGPVGPALTVMTFNVRFDQHSPEQVLRAVQVGDADLVALQELTPDLDAFLWERLSAQYPYRLSQAADWPCGSGIYSRYPLTEIENHAFYGGLLDTQDVTVTWNTHAIRFLNFHPVPPSLHWSPTVLGSIVLPDNYEADIRHAQVADLVSQLEDRTGQPVVVACDCNLDPASDDYERLTQGLRDGFREAGWGLGHTLLYNDRPNWLETVPLVRIDYIFHSPHFQATEARVLPYASSNHRPVVVRLAWP